MFGKKATQEPAGEHGILNFQKSEAVWTLEDAFSGTQIFGATGSGKTSASGFNYFLLAARQGHETAQYNVGVCFRDGIGVSRSHERAIQWLRLSAENGYKKAEKELNRLLGKAEPQQRQKVAVRCHACGGRGYPGMLAPCFSCRGSGVIWR